MTYTPFTVDTILDYARQFPTRLDVSGPLTSREIGDGNLNLVFQVSDQHGRSLIFKQALPYARVVGESWPLTTDRNRIEYEALGQHGALAPGFAPALYGFNHEQATMVMEDLSSYTVMRTALIEGYRGEAVYRKLGSYLARTLFFTSDLALDPSEKKQTVRPFINPELCRITELLIFTDPYYDSETNNIPPELHADVAALWSDTALRDAVANLKLAFLTRAEALLHGDLHTGSIMVRGDDVRVFDAEFAFFGPMAFDIGLLVGNLLLNYFANQPGLHTEEDAEYWISAVRDVWTSFEGEFVDLWIQHGTDRMFGSDSFRAQYMNRLLHEAIGFAGAEMIRRTIGLAHVKDLDGIADADDRAKARQLALRAGRWSILQAGHFDSVQAYLQALLLHL